MSSAKKPTKRKSPQDMLNGVQERLDATPERLARAKEAGETPTLDAVGFALERASAAGYTITATLGRHTNDRMLSFYVYGPDGTTVEYGWGGQNVPLLDSVPRYDRSTEWGHRPVEAGVVR